MENKKIIQITIAVMIVLTLLLVGYFFMVNSEEEVNSEERIFSVSGEMLFIPGTIKEIGDDFIVIVVSLFEDDSIISEKKIWISEETDFVRMSLMLWAKRTYAESDEIPISLGELKIGDSIDAKAVENVKEKEEFSATKIILLDFPE